MLKLGKKLRTVSLNSKFTGSYNKRVYLGEATLFEFVLQ